MIRIGKRRDAYRFTDKVHPKEGIISVIISAVLLLGFCALFIITSKQQGGLLVGVLGILIFFCSIIGLWFAIKAMRKEDIKYQFPIIGMILNGIVLIICVSLYFIGMASNISIG